MFHPNAMSPELAGMLRDPLKLPAQVSACIAPATEIRGTCPPSHQEPVASAHLLPSERMRHGAWSVKQCGWYRPHTMPGRKSMHTSNSTVVFDICAPISDMYGRSQPRKSYACQKWPSFSTYTSLAVAAAMPRCAFATFGYLPPDLSFEPKPSAPLLASRALR